MTWLIAACCVAQAVGLAGVLGWAYARKAGADGEALEPRTAGFPPDPGAGRAARAAEAGLPPATRPSARVAALAIEEVKAARAKLDALDAQQGRLQEEFAVLEARRVGQQSDLDEKFEGIREAFRRFELQYDREVEDYESRFRALMQKFRPDPRSARDMDLVEKGERERKSVHDIQREIHEFTFEFPADESKTARAVGLVDGLVEKLRAIPQTDALRTTLIAVRSDLRDLTSRLRPMKELAAERAEAKDRLDRATRDREAAAAKVAALTSAAVGSGPQSVAEAPGGGPAAAAGPPSKITKERFDRLRIDMTFRQVTAILGPPSRELSSETFQGVAHSVYLWNAGFLSNATLTFQEDRLVDKAELNLP